MGAAYGVDGARSEATETEAIGLLSAFWPACFEKMDTLIDPAA